MAAQKGQVFAWTPRGRWPGWPRQGGPGPFTAAWAGASPSCPVHPRLSGCPGQSVRRRRKCFPSSIGKNNSGARAAQGGGACASGLASANAAPAGSAPDMLTAPSTALVTGTEASGTAQQPQRGPQRCQEPPLQFLGGFAHLIPPGNKAERWVLSAPFYRRGH